MISYVNIKQKYLEKTYNFYTNHFDLNIFGVRSKSDKVDVYDDLIGIAFTDNEGNQICRVYPATTKPGIYWLENPMQANGTAIVKSGHYHSLWTPGDHHGYKALVQYSDVVVYRDNDKDGKIDMIPGSEETGNFGIDLHHGAIDDPDSPVGKYSAGCQVFQRISDFLEVMGYVDAQIEAGIGSAFSYALFNEIDFNGL